MHQIEEIGYSETALAHSMTFRGLNPYQVDGLCETMFIEFEKFVFNLPSNTKISAMKISDFKHIYVCGMREFHIKQINAQKAHYKGIFGRRRSAERISREVTPQQENRTRKKYKDYFDKVPPTKPQANE